MIVAQGTPKEIMRERRIRSPAQYLSGRRSIPMPKKRHKPDPERMLQTAGCVAATT